MKRPDRGQIPPRIFVKASPWPISEHWLPPCAYANFFSDVSDANVSIATRQLTAMSFVARGRTMSTVTPSLGDRFVVPIARLIDAATAGSPRYDFAHLSIRCILSLGLLRYEWRIL